MICYITKYGWFFYNVYTEDEVIASSLNYNILFYHKENVKKIENEIKEIEETRTEEIKKAQEDLTAKEKSYLVEIAIPSLTEQKME